MIFSSMVFHKNVQNKRTLDEIQDLGFGDLLALLSFIKILFKYVCIDDKFWNSQWNDFIFKVMTAMD